MWIRDSRRTASYNFRLRFDEQLLLYAQRPDATAVLPIERWNGSFGRWVNRGAKGIAVFEDENRQRQRLTHYFDISDTHGSRYARPVPLWQMKLEYESDVAETLENTFGEADDNSTLESIIEGCVGKDVYKRQLYQPVYQVSGLAGAVFEIRAISDVITPDGTLRYAAGELVDVYKRQP